MSSPSALVPLMRHGYDNLEVALRDPAFLSVNAPDADPERIRWLRNTLLTRRQALAVRTRAEARAEVLAACEQARLAAGIALPPVVLEFAYGACDSLDDYSSYLTPDRLDDLYAMIDGNFVGLGVELKQDDLGLLAGRRAQGRAGLGREARGRRPDHPRRRQADAGARPRCRRQPAPGRRGLSRDDHRPSRWSSRTP